MTPAKLADVVTRARSSESRHRALLEKPNPLVKDTAIVELADERDAMAAENARLREQLVDQREAAGRLKSALGDCQADFDELKVLTEKFRSQNAKLAALLERYATPFCFDDGRRALRLVVGLCAKCWRGRQ